MSVTAGVDVGSAAVKAVVMRVGDGEDDASRAAAVARVRRRERRARSSRRRSTRRSAAAGVDELDYVATTGEGEDVAVRARATSTA